MDLLGIFGNIASILGLFIGIFSLIITFKVNKWTKDAETLVKEHTEARTKQDQYDMTRVFLCAQIERATRNKLDTNIACEILGTIRHMVQSDSSLLTAFGDVDEADELLGARDAASLKKLSDKLRIWKGSLILPYANISEGNKINAKKAANDLN